MVRLKKEWWKILLIIIVSAFFDIVLHGLISPLSSSNVSLLKPSVFVKNGMLVPAVITWELLAFSIFSVVFIFIENNLPWKKPIKGLLYGFSFAMLYLIGMFESVLLTNSNIVHEFLMGLGDFFPFLLSGFLLGNFIGTEQIQNEKRNNILSIFVIAFFYLTGRYFAYSILHIHSAYITQPAATLVWTLCQGLWIGVIFYILQSGAIGNLIIKQAIFFGIVIFGANWFGNHLFIVFISEFSFDIFIRVGMDIISVIIGVYVYKEIYTNKI